MEVTLDKWQKWVSALIEGDNSVVTKLNKAANDLERNIKLQNEGKWGTEERPQAFARVYKSYLEQEVAPLSRRQTPVAGNLRHRRQTSRPAPHKTQANPPTNEQDTPASSKDTPPPTGNKPSPNSPPPTPTESPPTSNPHTQKN